MIHAFSRPLVRAGGALTSWTLNRWMIAGGGAVLTALAVGIPTDVVPNPLFGRSVPVQGWNYPALAMSAVLTGILLATYIRESADPSPRASADSRLGSFGGALSFFAVGCPVCNKLVLLLFGTSGALNYWAPVQPLVAVLSIALLAVAAVRRLSGQVACSLSSRP